MVAPEPGVVLELQDGAPKTRSNWVVPRRGSSRSFRMAPKADVAAVTAMEADAGCPTMVPAARRDVPPQQWRLMKMDC
jgi:hypothetical protein